MEECLFCDIASDSSKLVWEDEAVAAFNDIRPKAPVHVLVVPKQHVARLDDLTDPKLAGELFTAVAKVAQHLGVKGGYRIVINNGPSAGQVVGHLHLHLLGRKLQSDFSFDEDL